MHDEDKTKTELIAEVRELRQRLNALPAGPSSRRVREIMRSMLLNVPIMVTAIDGDGTIVVWNKECERVTGYLAGEIIENPRGAELLCSDEAYRQRLLDRLLTCDGGFRDLEANINCKDGSVKQIAWSSTVGQFPIPGWHLWSVGVDLTKHRQAEEHLRRREQEFKTLVENSPDIIARIDRDLRCIYVNPEVEVVTGRVPQEFIGCKIEDMGFEQADYLAWQENILRVFVYRVASVREVKYINLAGRQYCYLSQLVPEFTDDGKVATVLCILRDITERSTMQAEMDRLERLNLIGEMAAGIGHEVRNPMTTVRGFLQMMAGKKDCYRYREYYDIMIAELDRANSIITEFLSLAKNKVVKKEMADLNSVVKMLLPLVLADGIVDNKYVQTELQDIPRLFVDQKEIRQLILNLVLNGLEAMNPGGKLFIRTSYEAGHVVLAVQDEGSGIAPEVMDKLGTPFFTTKEKGTGLGLAVCYSIASRHNSVITVKTGQEGTVFFVRFKVREAATEVI